VRGADAIVQATRLRARLLRPQKIAILDFGGQYTQLIALRAVMRSTHTPQGKTLLGIYYGMQGWDVLSGGVDSSVVAALIHRAAGDQLTCLFVDNGSSARSGRPSRCCCRSGPWA
jgi:hypothetical protein